MQWRVNPYQIAGPGRITRPNLLRRLRIFPQNLLSYLPQSHKLGFINRPTSARGLRKPQNHGSIIEILCGAPILHCPFTPQNDAVLATVTLVSGVFSSRRKLLPPSVFHRRRRAGEGGVVEGVDGPAPKHRDFGAY